MNMNVRALAGSPPVGSPPENDVSIAATFSFLNGTPITINSGNITDLKNGIVSFSISEPVVLGSLRDFVQWLTDRFGFPNINGDIDDLKSQIQTNALLTSLYNGFMDFYNGTITIMVLSINRAKIVGDPTKTAYKYQLAVTFTPLHPIDFFGIIQFDSIGISVNKSGTA